MAAVWFNRSLARLHPGAALQLHLDRGDMVVGKLLEADATGVELDVDGGSALIPWPLIRWVQIEGPARRKLEADAARRKPKVKPAV